jgi:ribosome-associated protein
MRRQYSALLLGAVRERYHAAFGLFDFSMQEIEFQLAGHGDEAYVALCNLLKLTGIASSGGQGKLMVANGEVTVDGQPESRKTAKIRAGQVVDCLGQRIVVVAGA